MNNHSSSLGQRVRQVSAFCFGSAALLISTACTVFGVESVEEAPYTAVQKDGQFEVRDYSPIVVVQTRVDADYKKAGSSAFRKLFAYISGNNTASEKITMTAPVVSEKDAAEAGAKIAMTAPVIASSEGDTWLYRFVLPQSYTIDTAPRPLDPAVSLAEVPQRRVASVRFSGFLSDKSRARNSEALVSWIESQGLSSISDPRWASYNAPWALPPFRRNEVLVDISR